MAAEGCYSKVYCLACAPEAGEMEQGPGRQEGESPSRKGQVCGRAVAWGGRGGRSGLAGEVAASGPQRRRGGHHGARSSRTAYRWHRRSRIIRGAQVHELSSHRRHFSAISQTTITSYRPPRPDIYFLVLDRLHPELGPYEHGTTTCPPPRSLKSSLPATPSM